VERLAAVMARCAKRERELADALRHHLDYSKLAIELRNIDEYIEDLKPGRGYVLTPEGAKDLAGAKAFRRDIKRRLDEANRHNVERATQLEAAASRLERAIQRLGHAANEEDQLQQLLLQKDFAYEFTTLVDQKTIETAEIYLQKLKAEAEAESAPGAEPDDAEAIRASYLPAPAELELSTDGTGIIERLEKGRFEPIEDYQLNLAAQELSLAAGFDTLICLPLLRGVEHYPFQLNTARQALRTMRGRALLCDEVGLGKTIEAGLILKEYLVRGLARKVLILAPPALVSQWKEEMLEKFGIECVTHEDPRFRSQGTAAWEQEERVIASLHTAKNPANSEEIHKIAYDIVIVDEAHHLKNRTTLNWKFVNRLKSRYLLLLTATPVQNNLDELFNLITLLSPGQLKTATSFRREFVARGDTRKPKNQTKLRELLMDVMVRNTRSQVTVALPPRRAFTQRVELSQPERALYDCASEFVRREYRGRSSERLIAQTLQAEAGSSARALRSTLEALRKRGKRGGLESLLEQAAEVKTSAKADLLLELLRRHPGKHLIFTRYRETQEFLLESLNDAGISTAAFSGGMSAAEKDEQVVAFARDRQALVSTDVGSEGRNLQFCHNLVNYDLPWNPMQIEQRVGRVHRIGQMDPVQIFNLAAHDTLEDYVLQVLDSKINMFELVVGEVGEILGNLSEEREFEDLVMDLWLEAESTSAARQAFDQLGDQMIEARGEYIKARAYDNELFGEEFVAEE